MVRRERFRKGPLLSRLFAGHHPARGSDQEVFKKTVGRVVSGQEVFEVSRDGSSRARSGVFHQSRIGSGHPDTIRPPRRDPTREKPCLFYGTA